MRSSGVQAKSSLRTLREYAARIAARLARIFPVQSASAIDRGVRGRPRSTILSGGGSGRRRRQERRIQTAAETVSGGCCSWRRVRLTAAETGASNYSGHWLMSTSLVDRGNAAGVGIGNGIQ